MSTVTYQRRVGKTGRPLGLLDVFSKIVETAVTEFSAWATAYQAARLAKAAERRDAAQDAAKVRRMAYRYRNTAPGFAADLYSAADQHEWLSEK